MPYVGFYYLQVQTYLISTQVGPYIYEEKWDKVDVDWQNDTVSYRLKKSYR